MSEISVINSPFGKLKLVTHEGQLEKIELNSQEELVSSQDKTSSLVAEQLKSYFNSNSFSFKLDIVTQGTDFQKRVWDMLTKIPVGEVWTYGKLAEKLNTSARAVGNACRNNPTPIVVPCHRIVSASGLGGFAGKTDGVLSDIKRNLLKHEGVKFD